MSHTANLLAKPNDALLTLEEKGPITDEWIGVWVFVSLTELGYETKESFERLEKLAASTLPASL